MEMARFVPVIQALTDDELYDEQRALIAPFAQAQRDFAVFRTMLQHPAAMRAFLGWGAYILSEQNSLEPRLRELVILRTGAVRGCAYEFLRHAVIARQHGFTDDDLRKVARSSPDEWDGVEGMALRAVDELTDQGRISPPTFDALQGELGDKGAIDLLWTVGQYSQVCMFLLTAGVEPDPDIADDPLRELFA